MVGHYKHKTQQQYNKDYYNKNKDKLNHKFTCMNCNGSYSLTSMSQHFKTKKHLNALSKELWNEIMRIEREDVDFIDDIFS